MRYRCCETRRLAAVKAAGVLNGIEFVEVSHSDAPTPGLRQRTLYVRLLSPAPGLTVNNVIITGGDRIPSVDVEWVAPAVALPAGEDPSLVAGLTDPASMLLVRTVSRGDFSYYSLGLVAGGGTDAAPAGFDPLLTKVDFSFKIECEAGFDCRPGHRCPGHVEPSPTIDYMAKDYASFRRIMLDRLSLLAPGWQERNPADLGMALVEALAYVGDELSYRQDAVTTEAYLETARRRPSLRRHARLVDYRVHEGINARVWARVDPATEGVTIPGGTPLLTRVPGIPNRVEPGDHDHGAALSVGAETFETIEDAILYQAHNVFQFWTWGDVGCCLPRGATSATLFGHHPTLKAGDVLILQEVAGPSNGNPDDADPSHRAAVRLTHVTSSSDPSGGLFDAPPTISPVDVTEIEWDEEDALPFPLCISVEKLPGVIIADARGNIVLADHGRTVVDESLGSVDAGVLLTVGPTSGHCHPSTRTPIPGRFRPRLIERPLAHTQPGADDPIAKGPTSPGLDAELAALAVGPELESLLTAQGVGFKAGSPVLRGGDGWWSVSDGETVVGLRLQGTALSLFGRREPAGSIGSADPRTAAPAISLEGTTHTGTDTWQPVPDLLGSLGDSREFVVEMEHDRTATLRFGDGTHGRRPDIGTSFRATYRVGNGKVGNIGIDALGHLVSSEPDLLAVSNLVPAVGGIEPESAEAIRRDAPEAFLFQKRAVTANDYASMTEHNRDVQRAAATFRWTGSWHTVFVTADRTGGVPVDAPFETGIRRFLEPVRMAGYDLEVDGPVFVPLDIALFVCAEKEHFRSHVRSAVLDRLSSGARSDGSLGVFHPDRFTFGQPVYLSAMVAETQDVPGVESVTVVRFQRQRDDSSSGIDSGVLPMGRLEIARLDNDPSFPERGVLEVTMGGGK
jgi:hypothetical protein